MMHKDRQLEIYGPDGKGGLAWFLYALVKKIKVIPYAGLDYPADVFWELHPFLEGHYLSVLFR